MYLRGAIRHAGAGRARRRPRGRPQAAQASVGVGIQAGAVRLSGVAHPGQSVALPGVSVVNSGSHPESIRLSVQRISKGPGRAVPASWIQFGAPVVQLGPKHAMRVSLELVVPAGAKPGAYLSDIVATGSVAEASTGRASLGAAAATLLEFRVAPSAAPGFWWSVFTQALWALLILIALAAMVLVVRRSGIASGWSARRPVTAPPMRSEAGMRNLLVIAAIVIGGFLVLHVRQGGYRSRSAASRAQQQHRDHVQDHADLPHRHRLAGRGELRQLPARGPPNKSNGAMGFPNGTCAVGDRVKGKDPIKITYNGMQGYVYVHAGWALPNDNEVGTPWHPCSSGGQGAVRCTGKNGQPGYNQYTVRNFSPESPLAHADHRQQLV